MNHVVLALSALLFGTVLGIGSKTAPLRCSLQKTPFTYTRSTSEVYLLGMGMPDTVIVPRSYEPGFDIAVVPGTRPPLTLHSNLRGQRIRIDSFGGVAAEKLRAALNKLGSQSREIVAVPWDYRSDCATTPRLSRATFAPRGAQAFIIALLRPDSLWFRKIPTVDVLRADMSAYPYGTIFYDMLGPFPGGHLTAAEVYSVRRSLPDVFFPPNMNSEEWSGFRVWGAAHPSLAKKFPISDAMRGHLSSEFRVPPP
jgi:hypothetical protein